MSRFQTIRQECLEANQQLPRSGLVDLTFGNVSIADREAGAFAIKPSGVDYNALSSEDIVVLSIETGEVLAGQLRPSSDTPTHRRLFQAFTEIRSVVHTHSRNAVAFAQAERGIPCFGTTHADYFHGEVPCTRPMTPEEVTGDYEWNTAEVIIERFRELKVEPSSMPAVLVNRHGPFVWSSSGAKAVETALALEICAEMAWKALQLNPDARPIPHHLLDKHFFRKHGDSAYYGQI